MVEPSTSEPTQRRAECPQSEGQLAGRALPHGAGAAGWKGLLLGAV